MLFRMLFQLSFSVDSKDVWWYSNHVSVFLWSFILPLAKQASLISNHYMPCSKMSQACSVSRNSLFFCCCSELLAFCSWAGIFFFPLHLPCLASWFDALSFHLDPSSGVYLWTGWPVHIITSRATAHMKGETTNFNLYLKANCGEEESTTSPNLPYLKAWEGFCESIQKQVILITEEPKEPVAFHLMITLSQS